MPISLINGYTILPKNAQNCADSRINLPSRCILKQFNKQFFT